MGRLFWKFFFFVWISQLVVICFAILLLWMQDRIDDLNLAPDASCFIDSAISTLQNGDINKLKQRLIEYPRPVLYVVDENKKEILNRKISDTLLKQIFTLSEDSSIRTVQEAIGPDKRSYIFFMPILNKMGEYVFLQRPLFPFASMAAAGIVSLIIAAILAWYLYKPINYLRAGFSAVAKGDLNLRLESADLDSRHDELSDLSRDFDHMTKQLLNLMNSQRNLLYAVSHELRSPLARIQLAVGLFRQQPKKMEMLVDRIESETARLDDIIDEFMALSYLESDLLDLPKEQINFCSLLDEVISDAQFEASAKKQHIEYMACVPVYTHANAEYLHRAIENIVRNAIKYTPEQGTINIGVKSSTTDITLTVVDDGFGIPEDKLTTIFEPFVKGNNENRLGYGLGLTITKRVIELHKGTIKIYNNGGDLKGVCVEIILPVEGTHDIC